MSYAVYKNVQCISTRFSQKVIHTSLIKIDFIVEDHKADQNEHKSLKSKSCLLYSLLSSEKRYSIFKKAHVCTSPEMILIDTNYLIQIIFIEELLSTKCLFPWMKRIKVSVYHFKTKESEWNKG